MARVRRAHRQRCARHGPLYLSHARQLDARARRPAPVAGVAPRHRRGRHPQGQPQGPAAGRARRRQRAWPACSRSNRFCAAPVHGVPRAPRRRRRRSARWWSTPATPTPAPAQPAWPRRAPTCDAVGALLGCAAAAGAAVLHRRDHGAAAGRAHRRRAAGRASPTCAPDALARRGRTRIMTTDTVPKAASRRVDDRRRARSRSPASPRAPA
ncbi:MAG: hypothetical protein MZW92_01220 [Comamonadaceae bacterium]|nr:hypothetical protein [Comamonadaceae bacterium]